MRTQSADASPDLSAQKPCGCTVGHECTLVRADTPRSWRHTHCCMDSEQRSAAPRNRWLFTISLLLFPTALAYAGDARWIMPQPVAGTISAVTQAGQSSGTSLREGNDPRRQPAARLLSFLPPELHIPDAYNDEPDLLPHRLLGVINGDRIMAIDLLPHKQRGWMFAFAYDVESRGPLGNSGDYLGFYFEREF